MGRRLILHLGIFKTGTTLIQRSCMARRPALAEAGIHYLSFASNHGIALSPILMGLTDRVARWPDGGLDMGRAAARRNAQVEAAFEADLDALPRDATALLSGEHFPMLAPPLVERFLERLARHFDRIDAIALVREPGSFASSMAQQLVRDGQPLAALMANPPRQPLREMFAPWERTLGREALRIRPLSPGVSPLAQFLEAIDRPDLLSLLDDANLGHVNRAPSARAITVLDAINALEPGGGTNPRRPFAIAERVDVLPGPPFSLGTALEAHARADSAGDMAWLAERLGRDPFPTTPPDATAHPPPMPPTERDRSDAAELLEVTRRSQTASGRALATRGLSERDPDILWSSLHHFAELPPLLAFMETLEAEGYPEIAFAAAERAARIDPENTTAILALGRLGAQTPEEALT